MNDIFGDLLSQITDGKNGLLSYDSQIKKILTDINKFVTTRKSGSLLILGPRGALKSNLIDYCLSTENSDARKQITYVHLNGYLQSTDAAAVKEFARQLNVKMIDFLDDEEASIRRGLDQILKNFRKTRKCLLIVLDEFDRFATSKLGQQCILYNVFDSAHKSTVPLFIIGLASNLDVMDLLEKRVVSRLCPKQILFQNRIKSRAFRAHAKRLLTLPSENLPAKKNDSHVRWNQQLEDIFQNDEVKSCLKKQHQSATHLERLQQYLVAVLMCSNPRENEHFCLNVEMFKRASNYVLGSDYNSEILRDLSVVEICLLVAALRCIKKEYEADSLNFEIIYQEYQKFAGQNNNVRVTKAVAFRIFEKLLELGLFHPMNGKKTARYTATAKQYMRISLQMDEKSVKTYFKNNKLPTDVEKWLHAVW